MELSSPSNPDVDPSAKPSRRKSGRVIKAPAVFSPEGSAKRKRSDGEDSDNEAPDNAQESDDESDEEDSRKKQRKAKRTSSAKSTTKRPKMNGVISQLPIRPAAKSKAKKPKQAAKAKFVLADGAAGLFANVFASKYAIDDVVAAWLARFAQHEPNAMSEIVNFVLQCTGCSLEIDGYDIEDPDNCSNKLTEIQEEFQAQNVADYPLVAKNGTTFKRTLIEFFKSLVETVTAASLLHTKPVLMENIHIWVSTMSSATTRPFRHTATIVSLGMISALCEVARDITELRAKMLRQADAEASTTDKNRNKKKVNQGRVDQLHKEAEHAAERRVQVDAIIKDWFDTVFVHRYRDVDPKIRADCVMHLGEWIMTYPDLFFDGQHLRYLGWVLSDPSAPTRLEVIKQLHKIFKDENKISGLRVFTERFRSRIVEVAARDAEIPARAAAVELLDILRDAGLLEPDDIDTIGRLIYDTELRIRKAVVPFFVASVDETLSAKVEELGGQEGLDEIWPTENDDDFDSPRPDWLRFKCLAELLHAFDPDRNSSETIERGPEANSDMLLVTTNESRYALATSAIFAKMPDLKRWEVLAGYLLFDLSHSTGHGTSGDIEAQLKRQCKLEEREESILLDVLNTSVKLCLTDVPERGADKKVKLKKAHQQELNEEREIAAQRLAVLIPRLLKRFGAAPETASAVLRLEHVLNLEVFQELRQDSTTYSALLEDINKQFMSHKDRRVLIEASDALRHAKSFEELGDITEGKLQALCEDTTHSLVGLCRGEDISIRGGMENATLAELSSTVFRISNLARISDCTEALETPIQIKSSKPRRKQHSEPPVAPITLLIDLVGRGRLSAHVESETNAMEDALVSNTMNTVLFYFLWHVIRLRSSLASGKTHDDSISSLIERRDTFASYVDAISTQRPGVDDLRVFSAGILLDLHNMFVALAQSPAPAHHNDADTSPISSLVTPLSTTRQTTLLQILTATESDFAKKSKRELEPAPPSDEPQDHPPNADDADPESDDDDESEPPADADDDDDDDGEEGEEAARRRQLRAVQRQREELLAEEKLCTLASKLVIAVQAGVLDRGSATGPVRTRLGRNRGRLGHNFKEIVAALERRGGVGGKKGGVKGKKGEVVGDGTGTGKGSGRGKMVGGKVKGKMRGGEKSREFIVDEDVESEGSPDEDAEGDADGDGEEALRARGLVVDEEEEEDLELERRDGERGAAGREPASGDDGDGESVLGD